MATLRLLAPLILGCWASCLAGCSSSLEPTRETTSRPASDPEPAKPRLALTPTPRERLGTAPAGVALEVGARAPDAAVHGATGRSLQLASLWDDGPALLVFYRGGWCPYCNLQIQDLVSAAPELERRGVQPAAISVDRVEAAARTRTEAEVPFPVLSDPDLAAHEAFGVVHQVGPEEYAKLRGYGIDIEAASGRDHHRFAVPSLFLIDGEGVVRWAHADPDYAVRPSLEQLLTAVESALE